MIDNRLFCDADHATCNNRPHDHSVTVGRASLRHVHSTRTSGKSGPKDQVALHYYYTSPSHWCTTHEVSKL